MIRDKGIGEYLFLVHTTVGRYGQLSYTYILRAGIPTTPTICMLFS